MGKEKPEKKVDSSAPANEIVEARPVVSAAVFHDGDTGLYGLNVSPRVLPDDAVKECGRVTFETVEEGVTPDAWPSAWLNEEDAQALADALQAAGITPSGPTEIVAVLQKQLEDMKEIAHGLMDVLKTGQEG